MNSEPVPIMALRNFISLLALALLCLTAPAYAQDGHAQDGHAQDGHAQDGGDPLESLQQRERQLSAALDKEEQTFSSRIDKIRGETQQQLDSLADQKARLLSKIDALPADLSEKERAEQVDPILDKLVGLRREVHAHFDQAVDKAHQAKEPVHRADEAVEDARRRLAEERARKEQLGGSTIWQHRVEVAQAKLALAEKHLADARAIRTAYRHRVRALRAHLSFFTATLEPLLERVSDARRAAFFALDDEQHWHDALVALHNGLRGVTVKAAERSQQIVEADATAVDLWAWLWAIVWRLAVALVFGRFLVRLMPSLVDRLSESLLRNRFWARHPAAIINLAEIIRALTWPLVVFAGSEYVAGYIASTVPEFQALVWIIDAICIYWVVIETSRVLVLPRWYRHSQGHASAQEFDNIDEDEAASVADLVVLELPRAKKLVRSVRVVTVFWLLSAYLPDFLEPLTGITVIWWLVNQLAVWGFIGVVYWVLSQWKDDIAAGFEKLATDRLAGSVEFVHKHKDRPWGVLVIGVASLYVIAKELAIIARRYLRDTSWARRASTIAFRTKIEIQNLEEAAQDQANAASNVDLLPPDYLVLFEPRPLTDEPYRIDRTAYLERITSRFEAWLDERRQGSITLLGEPGVGKTTLLNGLSNRFEDAADLPVIDAQLDEKLRRPAQVIAYLAGLFGLDDAPDDVHELIEVLRTREPRVVLLDDCHNAFTRQIEGFDSLDTLLDVVNLCDETHFFVLTFNRFAWNYADRINSREYYFGELITLEPWTDDEIQELIEQRNAQTPYTPSFNELMSTRADRDLNDYFFEVVKTANGYFRYLHDFCGGNPAVATQYWLRSLRPAEATHALQVGLFRRPSLRELTSCSDDHWFLLSALAQHGALDARELAHIVNLPLGFCNLAVDYFAEEDVVAVDPDSGRARLTPLYLRQVLKHLRNSNFLYG